MAEIGSVKISQNTSDQMRKAEDLQSLVESIVSKIEEIDTEITNLVRGGLEGTSVQSMANSYIKNREVINDYVKRFAATACVLYDDAQDMMNEEMNANTAAGGVEA